MSADAVNEICYGIAIHVEDEADFEWVRTPFSETVGDADNIDRFDAHRIYETLEYLKLSEMSLANKLVGEQFDDFVRLSLWNNLNCRYIFIQTKKSRLRRNGFWTFGPSGEIRTPGILNPKSCKFEPYIILIQK